MNREPERNGNEGEKWGEDAPIDSRLEEIFQEEADRKEIPADRAKPVPVPMKAPSVPKKRNHINKEALVNRRRIVARYMVRGLPASQILGLIKKDYPDTNLKAVEHDMFYIRCRMKEDVEKIDVSQEVGNSLATFQEIEREGWNLYYIEKDAYRRSQILKQIQDAREAQVKLLERMGLLVPVVRHVIEVGKTWEERVRELREERGVETESLQEGLESARLIAAIEEEIVPLSEQVIDAHFTDVPNPLEAELPSDR